MKKVLAGVITFLIVCSGIALANPDGFKGIYTTPTPSDPNCVIRKSSGQIVHAVFEGHAPLKNRQEKLLKDGFNAVVNVRIYEANQKTYIYGTPVQVECRY